MFDHESISSVNPTATRSPTGACAVNNLCHIPTTASRSARIRASSRGARSPREVVSNAASRTTTPAAS